MGKANINWDKVETWERLVSSLLAAGFNPKLRAAAVYYGTTYDTLENRFRLLKKKADALRTENGELPIHRSVRITSTPTSPSKRDGLETVTAGRITKETPFKKTNKHVVVTIDSDSDSTNLGGLPTPSNTSNSDTEAPQSTDFAQALDNVRLMGMTTATPTQHNCSPCFGKLDMDGGYLMGGFEVPDWYSKRY